MIGAQPARRSARPRSPHQPPAIQTVPQHIFHPNGSSVLSFCQAGFRDITHLMSRKAAPFPPPAVTLAAENAADCVT